MGIHQGITQIEIGRGKGIIYQKGVVISFKWLLSNFPSLL